MPTRRLRRHLLDRFLHDARVVGELGLAFLMTAGVASCGGVQSGVLENEGGADGETDGATDDHGRAYEAAQFEGGVVEAAQHEGGIIVEAAQFEGGVLEAGLNDGGPTETGVIVEAAIDAGHK